MDTDTSENPLNTNPDHNFLLLNHILKVSLEGKHRGRTPDLYSRVHRPASHPHQQEGYHVWEQLESGMKLKAK